MQRDSKESVDSRGLGFEEFKETLELNFSPQDQNQIVNQGPPVLSEIAQERNVNFIIDVRGKRGRSSSWEKGKHIFRFLYHEKQSNRPPPSHQGVLEVIKICKGSNF